MQFGKYVSAATDTKETTEERCYLCGPRRGGKKREASAWGYNWVTLFLGDIYILGPGPSRLEGFEYETEKYGHQSRRTRTWE
jgi:hypothetical protein